jgi:hypothetical protein
VTSTLVVGAAAGAPSSCVCAAAPVGAAWGVDWPSAGAVKQIANTAAAAACFNLIGKPLVPAKPALIPAECLNDRRPNAKATRTWPNLGTGS